MKEHEKEYNQMPKHTHSYCAWTMVTEDHRHAMSGFVTEEADTPCHKHFYQGITSCSDDHTHNYSGWTGPAMTIPGGHVHIMKGETSKNDGHRHCYKHPTSGMGSCR